MKFLIGKKQEMKQVFAEDGTAQTVTSIVAGPCFVTAQKDAAKDGYSAVQLAWDEVSTKKTNKPLLGFFKKIFNKDVAYKHVQECRFPDNDKMLEQLVPGQEVTVAMFNVGDLVDVSGTSKGHGFQGVVKRHGFHGGPKSHGHKDQLRMPGSIGAGGVQRVFKGKRMGGHMGDQGVTVKNLKVIGIDLKKNEILLGGSVPGARNGILALRAAGDFEINKPAIQAEPTTAVNVNNEVVAEPEKKEEANV